LERKRNRGRIVEGSYLNMNRKYKWKDLTGRMVGDNLRSEYKCATLLLSPFFFICRVLV
jgi:hypothetical protein